MKTRKIVLLACLLCAGVQAGAQLQPQTRVGVRRWTQSERMQTAVMPTERTQTASPPPQQGLAAAQRPVEPQQPQLQPPLFDTIRTRREHSGIFEYPSRRLTPYLTGRAKAMELARNTPPMLAVKTNLLSWAAMGTAHLAGEIGLGHRTSLELAGQMNRWNLKGSVANNKKLVHWVVKPEFRYWLRERYDGHLFGVHAFYGQYNVGGWDIPLLFEREFRYEGSVFGAGLNYGYHLPIAKRFGMEFTAGVGVAQLRYTKSDCIKCGLPIEKLSKTYFGPTQLGVKLIFMIR